jgi:CDP-glycerol glycerophosphotransferase (TagB/SpsB family)
MPTHRLEGSNSIQFLINDLKTIESQLADMHVLLLVKVHFFHLQELDSLKDRLNSVLFVEERDINQDIYTILPETDFLVTDYPSVYFDYLLLNKPIIFAPFDIEQYVENDRALYYNYDDVTPGPKARNWREVMECIEDILTKSDAFEDERRRVSRMFNAYDDGCSSKRVYDAIVTTLCSGLASERRFIRTSRKPNHKTYAASKLQLCEQRRILQDAVTIGENL